MRLFSIYMQLQEGSTMKALVNIANGTEDSDYVLISRNGAFFGQSDASGKVSLIVGTDSGFESVSTLYYTSVKAVFHKLTD